MPARHRRPRRAHRRLRPRFDGVVDGTFQRRAGHRAATSRTRSRPASHQRAGAAQAAGAVRRRDRPGARSRSARATRWSITTDEGVRPDSTTGDARAAAPGIRRRTARSPRATRHRSATVPRPSCSPAGTTPRRTTSIGSPSRAPGRGGRSGQLAALPAVPRICAGLSRAAGRHPTSTSSRSTRRSPRCRCSLTGTRAAAGHGQHPRRRDRDRAPDRRLRCPPGAARGPRAGAARPGKAGVSLCGGGGQGEALLLWR